MENFDIVMEKAYSEDMEKTMTKQYEDLKTIKSSESMKAAKKYLSQARENAKKGYKKEAVDLYKKCIKEIDNTAKSFNKIVNNLLSSGSNSERVKKILIGGGLAMLGNILSFAGAVGFAKKTGNTTGAFVGQIAGSSASLVGQNLYYAKIDKENEENLKAFAKSVKEDPKNTMRKLLSDLMSMREAVVNEMKEVQKS